MNAEEYRKAMSAKYGPTYSVDMLTEEEEMMFKLSKEEEVRNVEVNNISGRVQIRVG